MTLDQAKNAVLNAGYEIAAEARLPNGTGCQLRLKSGQCVNVFDTGNYNVQGKDPGGAVKNLLAGAAAGKPAGRKVFVVYGRDEQALAQLEVMLRRWDLEPLILRRLPSEGKTVIEKLEHYQEGVDFGVVLGACAAGVRGTPAVCVVTHGVGA